MGAEGSTSKKQSTCQEAATVIRERETIIAALLAGNVLILRQLATGNDCKNPSWWRRQIRGRTKQTESSNPSVTTTEKCLLMACGVPELERNVRRIQLLRRDVAPIRIEAPVDAAAVLRTCWEVGFDCRAALRITNLVEKLWPERLSEMARQARRSLDDIELLHIVKTSQDTLLQTLEDIVVYGWWNDHLDASTILTKFIIDFLRNIRDKAERDVVTTIRLLQLVHNLQECNLVLTKRQDRKIKRLSKDVTVSSQSFPSLEQLSRRSIRQQIGGRSYREKITRLCLPKTQIQLLQWSPFYFRYSYS